MAAVEGRILKEWKLLRVLPKHVKAHNLKILYFRKGLIAVEKPFGLPVHNGPGVKLCLTDLLPDLQKKLRLDSMPELVNRIDKDSCGVQLLSYNRQAAKLMEELYERRRILKEYLAITVGVPSAMSGTISIPIGVGTVSQKEKMVLRRDLINQQAHDCPPDVKFPITNFSVLDSNKDTCALVKFTSRTGYKHQIRVHSADALGCPILGDHKYSECYGPQTLPLRLIQLLGIIGVKAETREKGRVRPWQRALVPMHLLASQVTIPELQDKPVHITSGIPPYFKWSLSLLGLHPKRANIMHSKLNLQLPENHFDQVDVGERLSRL